jgi:ABC-type nitrate/sulfonate/bicarbonate transport system ATPase subunit
MQQKDLLLPFAKAIDNAAAPLTLRKVPKQEARETVKPYFAKFGLGGCEDLYPNQLSGGMRQRVALIRALLFSADMLLLDEPLSALDTLTRADMQEFLRTALREAGCTAVLVTHDPEEALFLADRIYILSGKPGHISAEYRVPVPQNAAMQPTRGLLLSPEYIDLKRRILATL